MKKRISEKHLARFYKLMSVHMTDFDCGGLCSPDNDGMPHCCDNEREVPVLFHEEYKWLKTKNKKFWKKLPDDKHDFIKECCSFYVFAGCPGPFECNRNTRAIVCRTYPFEPHLDTKGNILGLTFQDDKSKNCPLIGKPIKTFNPEYIKNSIQLWHEIMELYEEERELYIDESKKRRRRAKRKGNKIPIFVPTANSVRTQYLIP